MWFRKNKWKTIFPLLVVAVLAAAFYFGGDAPGSEGWDVGDAPPVVSALPEEEVPPVSVPADQGQVNSAPESSETPEQTPEPTPAPEQTQPPMEIVPETGKDQYLTEPVTEGNPLPVEPQDVTISTMVRTCTISISCATILDNMDYCDNTKVGLVPEDGWILQPTAVTFYEGESVFNVLQRTCKQQNIHMEFEDTPIYNSAYIEGIHNLYEFDVGELSGWMYQVNDWFPNYGCSRYQLRDGDVICWVYTCDLGTDVGGGYSAGNGRS